jgi:hypothetical protein
MSSITRYAVYSVTDYTARNMSSETSETEIAIKKLTYIHIADKHGKKGWMRPKSNATQKGLDEAENGETTMG